MSMKSSGAPWLDSPVMLHSSREYKCSLKTAELCAYQQGYWRFWYEADHRYALPTIGLFCAGIALFALFAIASRFAPKRISASPAARRAVALNRYLSYRVLRIPALNWNSAPIGVLLLGAVGAIFFFAMTLGPRPYYWPNTKTLSFGNSPPIATRTGWMALGCLPFVIATSSKSNMITAFTGISHEKLQVFHRWISYAMFVLGLIHTFPFIVFHFWKGDMITVWSTSVVYWTGVVTLIAQAWLTFASMSPLRNWHYELFKFSHFLAALVFVLFFFFHCDFRLSSWDYFIATAVLFTLTFLHSQLRVFLEHGIGKRAHLHLESNGFIRVGVPTTGTWRAGQHYFIRFLVPGLGIHALSSHPFTTCSLPTRASFHETKESELVFYIRPHGGFTKRLAHHIAQHPAGSSVRVLLDGPYGGCDMQKIEAAERIVAVAGGSGAGFLLPLVEAFLRRLELRTAGDSGELARPRPSMRVILATRDMATRGWFERAVGRLIAGARVDAAMRDVAVEVNYTGADLSTSSSEPVLATALDDPEKGPAVHEIKNVSSSSSSSSSSNSGQTASDSASLKSRVSARSGTSALASITGKIAEKRDRPDLPSIIATEAAERREQRLAVFVCGPLSMQKDVSNTAARENLTLLRGTSAGELYLHMEHFSWA